MAENSDELLRRSLVAVDRHRNRLLIGTAIATVLLLLALVHGADAMHSGNTNNILHAVLLVLGIWMTILTLVVVIQITVMTKRILRVIELALKK